MLGGPEGPQSIEITVEPHAGIRRRCSRCQKPAPGYDCLPQRRWLFVPLWGIATYFCSLVSKTIFSGLGSRAG
jgi:hypothetical protein